MIHETYPSLFIIRLFSRSPIPLTPLEMVFHYDSSDPLAIVTAPPPNETPEEKAAREEREAEAQRISDQIDDELRVERAALKKQEQIVKILLLGQSESGKSTSISSWEYVCPPVGFPVLLQNYS
jgi:hypothetical protein